MEAETLTLPENSVIESSQSDNFEFPKPDFTEIVQEYENTNNEKCETPLLKPTFKNALQAKKRLQAFSSTRPNSLPSSPKKPKLNSEEKPEDKKTTKKGNSHDDKAKAVIEEIEELKREELAYLRSHKRSRSRSRSNDKGRFKRVEKKSRNYRRRSISTEKPRKTPKKVKKYPRNWREFHEINIGFDVNKHFNVVPPIGNNEISKQLFFESPSLQIIPFKMKTVNRDEKVVPFQYIRYTRAKPSISYSVNFGAIKEVNLSRKMIFDALPKHLASLENLYSNSVKFTVNESDSKIKKSRSWYSKTWKDSETECKLLEKSVSLSFLQTYTGEDEENDFIEEEPIKTNKSEKNEKPEKKNNTEIEKKKKRKHKAKKKQEEIPKKKKLKKEKLKKKERRNKEKKIKSKKDKIKKHEDKEDKQKKKDEHKEIKSEKHESRKRKHSDRDEENKRTKIEKHEESDTEMKEHDVKNKLEKEKKVDLNIVKLESKTKDDVKTKTDEILVVTNKKTRWAEAAPVKEETNCVEEKYIEENPKESINSDKSNLEVDSKKIKDSTPDTDEYHSHWESDDDVSSSLNRQSLKLNRSWESDEELFERSQTLAKKPSEIYTNLEIPLNIKNFSRRSTTWDEKSFSVIEELKLLEEERKTLSEERKKLELEKQKIMKLQEEAKTLDEKKDEMKLINEEVKVKKEKCEMIEFNIDSLNNSLSNVSSGESSFPIAALENEYEEFMKAVSSESTTPKKKIDRESSESSSSSSSSSDSDHKKKKRKSKMKKKKKKKKRECEGLLLGKGNNIFNEFDIPVPSDLPEIVPTPVPVPSPIVPLDKIIPLTTPNLLLNLEEPKSDDNLTKPFVFSSIVLPNKKPQLVDNSQLKLDDDSDTEDFTDKFTKKQEEPPEKSETPPKLEIETLEEQPNETQKLETPPKIEETKAPSIEPIARPLKSLEHKHSRSKSPPRKLIDRPRDRRRSRSRSRESKRRSPIRRRDTSPLSRRRHSSPRRRSPPRRRGSPWRRSTSPRRRSPRRRRRTPSLSPPRCRGGTRKRTPSPKRRASPLHSPLDGFKRSVADSTISDDMLPQPTPDEYNESPNSYGGAPKYFGKKRSSLSPQLSPRRISLDDRINQVLGLKENELQLQAPPPKLQDPYPNYYNNPYGQQYQNYNQFPPTKNDYVPPYGQMLYNQPPPNIVKPLPTPSKVVQVGNILQVVPTEELPVLETKPPESSQKILQVGNMLQIVPGVMPPTSIPEPQPTVNPVQPPEKQSAEALMKQKAAERKAEREKRRQERERRRKEKEKKRKEREKRKQLKLKLKTENMIKRAIQLEAEALANEDAEEEGDNSEQVIQWPPVSVIVASSPNCKGILLQGGSKQRKSVQFADGIRPGEGTSPSGGEELSSPPPRKLPKEKRFKKLKIPKKSKKKKVKVKVVKVQNNEEEDDEDEDDNLPPPSPPPGSPPPHVFPSRVKTHTINNVHPFVGNIIQSNPTGFPFRPPMSVVMNRHQPGPTPFIGGTYPTDVNSLQHPPYQGVSSHH